MSPPANTLGLVVANGRARVRRDAHAAVGVQRDAVRRRTTPAGSAGSRRRSMTASAWMVSSVPGTTSGTRRPRGPGAPRRVSTSLHALDAVVADDLDRLAVEEERDALLLAVLVVAARARHVVLVAPVGAGHAGRALADRGAVAVHRRCRRRRARRRACPRMSMKPRVARGRVRG